MGGRSGHSPVGERRYLAMFSVTWRDCGRERRFGPLGSQRRSPRPHPYASASYRQSIGQYAGKRSNTEAKIASAEGKFIGCDRQILKFQDPI